MTKTIDQVIQDAESVGANHFRVLGESVTLTAIQLLALHDQWIAEDRGDESGLLVEDSVMKEFDLAIDNAIASEA